jgi:hypothetical protein
VKLDGFRFSGSSTPASTIEATRFQRDRSVGITGYSVKGKQCDIRRKNFRVANISATSNNKIIEAEKSLC